MKRFTGLFALLALLLLTAPLTAQTPKSAPAVAVPAKAAPAATAAATPAPAVVKVVAAPASQPSAPVVTVAPQTWWQALLFDILKLVLSIFIPVLTVLVFWLLSKVGMKVELAKMDNLGTAAAQYAEQLAAQWLKEKGVKSTGAQKEDWAWDLVAAVDSKLGASAKARDKMRGLILSKIPAAEVAVAAAKEAKELTEIKPKPVDTPPAAA